MDFAELPPWLSVKQIADFLNVSENNIRNVIESEQLIAHRIGSGRGVIRVSVKEFQLYLDRVKQAPSVEPPTPRRNQRKLPIVGTTFKHVDVTRVLESKNRPKPR